VRRPEAVVREIETPQPLSILTAIRRQIGQFAKRKLAEEALQKSDKRFRTMIEHSEDPCAYYQERRAVMTAHARAVRFGTNRAGHPTDIRSGPSVRTRMDSLAGRTLSESCHAVSAQVSQNLLRPGDETAPPAGRTFSFGPFHLLPTQRLLLEDEKPLRLGSRALDILIALVERPGELVSKRELIARVWPDTVVVEANLTVHVAALRRALGDGHDGNRYLVNVPGRGYCFVAPVEIREEPKLSAVHATAAERAHNLPAPARGLISRDIIVSTLAAELSEQRLLTIVGPGGIGETFVALVAAEGLSGNYQHGVWLIDLAALCDPSLVPNAVASALGLQVRSENPLCDLRAFLREKQMLIVLDNSEHVIRAVAALAVKIQRGTPGVQILARLRSAGNRGGCPVIEVDRKSPGCVQNVEIDP